jgi:CcmD family protein
MNRMLTRLLLAVALLCSAPAIAQDSAAAASPAPSSGLPAGMGVPRTMRSYTHVFVAFSVAWVLLFGYTVSIDRRFRKLEEQVDSLGR